MISFRYDRYYSLSHLINAVFWVMLGVIVLVVFSSKNAVFCITFLTGYIIQFKVGSF